MRRFLLLALATVVTFAAAATTDFRELSWDELVPEGAWEAQMDPSAEPFDPWTSPSPEGYPIVEKLDGQKVKLPGFIVPLGAQYA